MHEFDLLTNLGLAIIFSTVFAICAKALKQPLILAYLAAGIVLGPEMGVGLIKDETNINIISEIGLILLLFIIGLEIDFKKLVSSGRTLIISGISQFIICTAVGIGFFMCLGFSLKNNQFDALYLSIALALSSTMIVVKLLYDKFELTTLPGRITLGILVFQDIWAILFLSLQPNLMSPSAANILLSFAKGLGLILFSIIASKYLLGRIFNFIAKVPELLLVTAIAWCFLLSGLAGFIGLTREMGALVAGISLSAFPYNIDVIAKVVNIRDFFVTLFFVGLGMQIPAPSPSLLGYAATTSVFLIVTRFVSVFPVLFVMKSGLRASLLPSINLSQMSEFSLVIASVGLSLGHISAQTVGIITVVFSILSIVSTYMIQYNHQIQHIVSLLLEKLGFKDIHTDQQDLKNREQGKEIVFFGFFREASSIFYEIEHLQEDGENFVTNKVLVIDFNPSVYYKLKSRGVMCVYGDISSLDTLQHAHIESAKVVVSSIPDSILRGTTNHRLMQFVKRICPSAQVIVTDNTIQSALSLYDRGADFVFIPRLHSAKYMARIIAESLNNNLDSYKKEEIDNLLKRKEVIG